MSLLAIDYFLKKIHHQIIRVVLIENKICCWTLGFF
jgi:hypothetical protein